MMKSLVWVVLATWVGTLHAGGPLKHAFDSDLGGIRTPYTEALLRQLQDWPPKDIDFESPDPNPVRLQAIETPDDEYYVGVEQVMWVHAPLAAVDGVLRDFDHLAEIFPGYEKIETVEHDGNRWLTYWEQRIPFPFVRNVKYMMNYLVDDSRPGRVLYRFNLKESNRLKASDGAIVIETRGDRTLYTEFDFFDADWGIVKVLAPGRIWGDSLEGIYLSDAAIKAKAEHPDWDAEHVRHQAEEWLDRFPVKGLAKHRKRFPKLNIKR